MYLHVSTLFLTIILGYTSLSILECFQEVLEIGCHFFFTALMLNLGLYVVVNFVMLNPDISCFANSVDPDQLASEEANWSGSALFAIMLIYSNNPDQAIWLAEN